MSPTKAPSELIVDPFFRALAGDPSPDDLTALRHDILLRGCLEPISVWKGVIVDGYHRYEICRAASIPFETTSVSFCSRDLATCWICHNELQKIDLPTVRKTYLLGKLILLRGSRLRSSFREKCEFTCGVSAGIEPFSFDSKSDIYDDLARRYHAGHSTMLKYRNYAIALDAIREVSPQLFRRVLCGSVRLPLRTMDLLNTLSSDLLSVLAEQVIDNDIPRITVSFIRDLIDTAPEPNTAPVMTKCVKDDPDFDPDLSVAGLIYTVPSWRFSLERIREDDSYPHRLSPHARHDFKTVLLSLRDTLDSFIDEL